MANESREQGPGARPVIIGEPRTPRRTWIVWILVLGGVIGLMIFKERMDSPGEVISQYRFEQLVEQGQIVNATVNYDPQNSALNEVVGRYFKTEGDAKIQVPFRARIRMTNALERKIFSLPQFEPRQPNVMLVNVVFSVLPFVIIAALIWFLFIRQIKRATKTSPSAAEVNARALEQQKRFDGILDKWEEQARRMDAVLERMEKR